MACRLFTGSSSNDPTLFLPVGYAVSTLLPAEEVRRRERLFSRGRAPSASLPIYNIRCVATPPRRKSCASEQNMIFRSKIRHFRYISSRQLCGSMHRSGDRLEINDLDHARGHTNPTRKRGDRLCIGCRPGPACLACASGWYVRSPSVRHRCDRSEPIDPWVNFEPPVALRSVMLDARQVGGTIVWGGRPASFQVRPGPSSRRRRSRWSGRVSRRSGNSRRGSGMFS
jgi:hypothetical protein